jgi:hypothetical protein
MSLFIEREENKKVSKGKRIPRILRSQNNPVQLFFFQFFTISLTDKVFRDNKSLSPYTHIIHFFVSHTFANLTLSVIFSLIFYFIFKVFLVTCTNEQRLNLMSLRSKFSREAQHRKQGNKCCT